MFVIQTQQQKRYGKEYNTTIICGRDTYTIDKTVCTRKEDTSYIQVQTKRSYLVEGKIYNNIKYLYIFPNIAKVIYNGDDIVEVEGKKLSDEI